MGGRGRSRGRAQQPQQGAPSRPGGPAQQYQQQGARPGSGSVQQRPAWGPPSRGGGPPQTSAPRAPQTSAPRAPQTGAPRPPQGAWGPRPEHQVRAQAPQQPQSNVGRSSYRTDTQPGEEARGGGLGEGGGGNGGNGASRGALRGRRVIPENILVTKPSNVVSKKGTTGSTIKISANYFKIEQKPDWCLYQYRVDFSPDEDLTNRRKYLLRIAIAGMNLNGYIFDGTLLYSPYRFADNPTELFAAPEESDEPVRVTIKLVGDVSSGDYHYTQIFNMILRKCMAYLNLQIVNRNFYDPTAKVNIQEYNLELWPGYVTSIRQHEHNILLCCEITHKVMRRDTMYDVYREVMSREPNNYQRVFTEMVIGAIVLTDYNNKTYRIDDVVFESKPTSTFEKSKGVHVSYMDYYKDRYGIRINVADQPMLISVARARELRAGQSETIMLVPELCRCTGLTDQQRNNFQLMSAVAKYTRVGPEQRIEKLHKFADRLRSNQKVMDELRQWDLRLAQRIVEFDARSFAPERICGKGREYSAGPFVDWTKDLRSAPLFNDIRMNNWYVIVPKKFSNSCYKFMELLNKAARGMSWQLGEPRTVEINEDRNQFYIQAIDRISEDSNCQLIMCVVPNNKNDRYSAIKKKCCVDKAIPTQVIMSKNLDSKGAMSIATKVAIQMNCKIGGAPWTVQIPLSGMMVIGYDVCHDPSSRGKSYGAFVASLDKQVTRYFSTVSHHSNGEELSNDFALSMTKAVREYYKIHNAYPDRIVIYRDGVGDGQLNYVVQHEIDMIKKALKEFYGEAPVKLAVIIVSKRINTRFFSTERNAIVNPPPGTVVDDIVTLPHRYDFFIVSQCTRQGTVSPTSYNVIYDTFGLPPDKLQILTYKLTHMYFNWSGTVRVPAPCQYAHKLAFLVSQSLRRSPNVGLEKLLYYL